MNGVCRGAAAAAAALLLASSTAGAAGALTGSGCAVSVPGYLAELARDYEKETGVKVVVFGGGSVRGLVDLQEGRMDFAASCQSPPPGDVGNLEYLLAAWDALVFIAHPSNPVSDVTPEQVRGIYEGKIDTWSRLGGPARPLVSIITSPKGFGGVVESLSKFVLRGRLPEPQRNSSLQSSSPAVWEQLVEQMPEGFASTGFGSARKRKVKMLKVNGVAPTRGTIVSGAYPFGRPLYLVVKKPAGPEVRKFVDFVLGPRGQALISSYGIPSRADMK